jgi:hypothetical protein
MEELLPLIIGILWLVYTIFGKNKKKKARRAQPEKQEVQKSPSILEQLLTDSDVINPQPVDFYDEPEEEDQIESAEEEIIEPKKKYEPFLRGELADFVTEGQSIIVPSEDEISDEKLDSEIEYEKLDFDLRKAIIFSEILNAPYIGYK